MNTSRRRVTSPGGASRFALIAVTGLLIGLTSGTVHAQTPATVASGTKPDTRAQATYEVRRGDTLFGIARKTRHSGASLYQMALALYRANPEAFLTGSINQLIIGQVLQIPGRESVLGVDPPQAASEVKNLVARPLAPVPSVQPPTKPVSAKPRAEPKSLPPKPPAPAPALSPAQAEERFQEGLAQDRKGDLRAALKAYLEAGQSGHGAAQKKLGDVYNTGNAIVPRDYETALKWYQKAREQGVEIPKPLTPGYRH